MIERSSESMKNTVNAVLDLFDTSALFIVYCELSRFPTYENFVDPT